MKIQMQRSTHKPPYNEHVDFASSMTFGPIETEEIHRQLKEKHQRDKYEQRRILMEQVKEQRAKLEESKRREKELDKIYASNMSERKEEAEEESIKKDELEISECS